MIMNEIIPKAAFLICVCSFEAETGGRRRRYAVTIKNRSSETNRYLYRFGCRRYVYLMQRRRLV